MKEAHRLGVAAPSQEPVEKLVTPIVERVERTTKPAEEPAPASPPEGTAVGSIDWDTRTNKLTSDLPADPWRQYKDIERKRIAMTLRYMRMLPAWKNRMHEALKKPPGDTRLLAIIKVLEDFWRLVGDPTRPRERKIMVHG